MRTQRFAGGATALLEDDRRWGKRQLEMEGWYRDLIAEPDDAAQCFVNDYGPLADFLARIQGAVLDVGGGNGIARHHLPQVERYVVVEPSLTWLEPSWSAIADRFPCLENRPPFVRGVGEALPFASGSFDAALALWSLNHVRQPGEVVREVSRILRPGGLFLVVLEDMEPRWIDILGGAFVVRGFLRRAASAVAKLASQTGARRWPVEADHLRIAESDLPVWGAPDLEIAKRAWIGRYLTFELRRA